jgi:hypothetical protein
MSHRVGRNDPCPCGSGIKFKRCCLDNDREPMPKQATAEGPGGGRDGVTLLIETARGVMARWVPSASPLRTDLRHGSAAEVATHDAAAVWGLPDFVYRPETQPVGSGSRELGDGTIIAGDLGVVLQVKSREEPSRDSAKEARWLHKKTAQALGQGLGTIRRLHVASVDLTNLRGTTLNIDASQYRWLVVVVLNHPDPPENVEPSISDARHPAVALLRRDWEFLFDQLKSTYAVIQYFDRVAGEDIALGDEPMRYYELAQADAAEPREVFPPALAVTGTTVSAPLLPMAPAALDDRVEHQVFRAMLEDIALTRLTDADETDRLRILGELDRLPVGQRANVGRFVLDAMDEVSKDQSEGILWRLRSLRGHSRRIHLGFGACSRPYSEQIKHGLRLWTELRHHDVVAATGEPDGLTTVAVLLTPRTHGPRPWDTNVAAVSGDITFAPDDLKQLRQLWPGPERA